MTFPPLLPALSVTPLAAIEVERRHLLAASALVLAWPRALRRCADVPSWEQFLVEAPKRVGELAQGKSAAEQDAYLYTLASLAAQIESVPGGKLSAFARLDPKVLFGMLHRGTPFFVVEWRLEPNAVLPAHCHPGASVCTLALEGAAEIRHYEVEPGAPAYDSKSEDAFTLRETRRQRLRPGALSTLSATRDNVHGFRAGAEGARGIDITTMHGGDGSFSFVDFDPETPLDPKLGSYEALWIGQEPR
ncbi:MAG: hypothetical protein EXS08_04135 [Planctomycetes bacterium]|nr:hypothetical protein [Planctomycetota bacterium]